MHYGMLMRPMAMDIEGNEKIWRTSDFWTDKNFRDEYSKYITASQHVIECAKIFVEKNWKKISDWRELNVVIKCKQGKFEFYNYVPRKKSEESTENPSPTSQGEKRARVVNSSSFSAIREEMERENEKKHNPILTLTDVVLDPTDGDFSLTINGQELWWINGEAVIEIADYIEEKLKNEQKGEKEENEENSGETSAG